MMGKGHIQTYCHIKNNEAWIEGKSIFKDEENTIAKDFFKALYKYLGVRYAKFHKMDNLCRLGFLASEILWKTVDRATLKPRRTAIIMANAASSLDTDKRHQISINDVENYYPSPAVFVYTLPNIVIGEISIRNKIQGENSFFIFESFNAKFQEEYIDVLFKTTRTEMCIGGWVDFLDGEYEAFLYVATKEKGKHMNIPFNEENLDLIYKNQFYFT